MDEPLQILTAEPPLIAGNGFIVTGLVVVAAPQEFMTRNVIVSTPGATPVTTPPDTVALLLLVSHALYSASAAPLTLNVIDDDTHTEPVPLILPASGDSLTVIVAIVLSVPQPLVTTYFMVSLPGLTLVTVPVLLTVATEVLVLLQMPPGVVALSVALLPVHIVEAPVMTGAVRGELTVTVTLAVSEQLLALVPVTV